jgi:tight adherence protein B
MTGFLGDPLLLLLGGGLGGSVLLAMLAVTGGGSRRLARRAARIAAGHAAGEAEALSLRRQGQSDMEAMLHRLLGRPEALRARFARTGRAITLPAYLAVSAAIGVAGAAAALMAGGPLKIAAPAGLVLGVWIPHLAITFLIGRRTARFEALFPEALGLMVRGLRSGLPVAESIAIVGREVGDPVGEEFRRVADQVRLGQPLDGALWEAAKRVDLTEFSFLVVTMSVQRETGGNLAETLENLDQVLRRRRQLKLKIKAMTAEARASSAIIGALPFVMLILLSVVNPAYVGLLFTTSTGHMMCAGGLASLAVGFGVMARMTRFEI